MKLQPITIIVILAGLMMVVGCSIQPEVEIPEHIKELEKLTVYSADHGPLSSIRFEEEQQFGEIYPALLPPSIGFGPAMAVDRNGNVYLANKGQKTIHVYHPDGRHLTDIGREGKGPGEFIRITAIRIQHNRLLVYDSNLTRIQIFSLNPVELSQTIILDTQSWDRFEEVRSTIPHTIFGLQDSTFLAGLLLNERSDRSYLGYYLLNGEGNIMSGKMFEQQRLLNYQGTVDDGGEVYVQLPFTSKGIVKVAPDGTIYHANSRDFLIRIYRADGEYQRAIYYPFDRDPLERKEALDQFSPWLHSAVRDADFPDTWPALESMFVDDQERIWVSTIVDDKEVYQWWVLEHSGKLLARFTWPSHESIQVVRDGKMYVSTKDKETGARHVVRYRVELQPI